MSPTDSVTSLKAEEEQVQDPRSADPAAPKKSLGTAKLRVRLLSVASVLVGLAAWQLLGQYAVHNALFLATPSSAIKAMAHLASGGKLWTDVAVSGYEFVVGFVLASLAGMALGLAMASSRSLAAVLQPWVSAFYATPIVALAPLLILWLGIGAPSKIAVVVSLVIFPVTINTESGLRAADRDLVEAATAFGADRREVFFKVLLPSALPYVMAGLRLGIGRGLIGVVVGELFGATAGLGFLINNSAQVFNMPDLFAGLIIFAFAGIVLTAGFRRLEKRLVHWQGV